MSIIDRLETPSPRNMEAANHVRGVKTIRLNLALENLSTMTMFRSSQLMSGIEGMNAATIRAFHRIDSDDL